MINHFRNENFYLSNFYECSITYDGLTYQNNEAAFQAQKCINDNDKKQFCNLKPGEAKHLGRKVSLRQDWEQVKVKIMHDIVFAKFTQHPDLRDKLLNTQDMYLEEGNNWGDRIWGTVNGQGQNLLGQILMQVREELSQEYSIEDYDILQ